MLIASFNSCHLNRDGTSGINAEFMKTLRLLTAMTTVALCLIITILYFAWAKPRALVEASNTRLLTMELPVTVAGLDAWCDQMSPPPQNNAAFQYLSAAQRFDMITPKRLDAVEVPPLGRRFSSAQVADMTTFVSAASDAYEILDAASTKKESLYPPDALKLTNVHRAMQALQLRALEAIAKGDAADAILRFEQFVHGVHSFQSAPDLFACKSRSSWLMAATRTVECLLDVVSLDEKDLGRLDAVLQPSYDDKSLLFAIVGARCMGLEQIEQHGGVLNDLTAAEYCAYFDHYIAIAEEGLPKRAEDLTTEARDRIEVSDPYRPNLHHYVRMYYDALASVQCARAAILVERQHISGNELPDDFVEFPDRVKGAWPEDPYTGEPIGYKRMDAGFIAYSIRYDGSGDGNLPPGAAPNAHREGSAQSIIVRVLQ